VDPIDLDGGEDELGGDSLEDEGDN